MPYNCSLSGSGNYAVKHNPWAYWTSDRTNCGLHNVPSGSLSSGQLRTDIVNGNLPNVGYVTPNLCNDAHDCSLGTADNWLKGWLDLIYTSPDFKSGHLAVIVTADEDDMTSVNLILTVVIHPSQRAHVVSTALTHYSWTRLMTDLTRAPCIRSGCTAANMATAFALPLG
jgi:acid phosphatase